MLCSVWCGVKKKLNLVNLVSIKRVDQVEGCDFILNIATSPVPGSH